MTDVQQARDPRAELADQLNFLHRWLRHVEALSRQKNAHVQRYQQYTPFKRKWGALAFLSWAAGTVLALAIVATPILQAIDDAHAKAVHSFGVPQEDPLAVGILAIPVGLIVAVLAVLFRNKVFLPRHKDKVTEVNSLREHHNDLVAADERELNAQLAQASQEYAQHVGDSFPQAYLYGEAVDFFIVMVHNHRATTIQEAINLYETQLHRNRMENLAQANLAEARRANTLMAVGNVINAMGHAATVNAVRAEGAATRSAAAANAARVTEQLRKPRTVFVKRR